MIFVSRCSFFLGIAACLAATPAIAAETYMLRAPIVHELKLGVPGAITGQSVNMLYNAGNLFLFYKAFGAHATEVYGLFTAVREIPWIGGIPQAQLRIKAAFARKKEMEKIAELPGIKSIQVISTAQLESKNLLKPSMLTESTVFVQSDGMPPTVPDSGEWVLIKDPESAVLTFRLKIKDQYVASPVEVPITALRREGGTPLSSQMRSEWLESINAWKSGYSHWKRFNPMGSLDENLAIEATLTTDGKTIRIGDKHLTAGKPVQDLLGNTLTKHLLRWTKWAVSVESPRPQAPVAKLPVKHIEVIDKGERASQCKDIVRRALGTLYLR